MNRISYNRLWPAVMASVLLQGTAHRQFSVIVALCQGKLVHCDVSPKPPRSMLVRQARHRAILSVRCLRHNCVSPWSAESTRCFASHGQPNYRFHTLAFPALLPTNPPPRCLLRNRLYHLVVWRPYRQVLRSSGAMWALVWMSTQASKRSVSAASRRLTIPTPYCDCSS